MLALALGLAAGPALAQQPAAESAVETAPENHVADVLAFLAGGAIGLVAHETGHLGFDLAFDARPGIRGVHLGPFPFFAVTHRSGLSPRREFTISSAGFWVQEGTDEWLLTARPRLRDDRAWLAKGVLAFNVLTSIGYAGVGFAKAGPAERDTRGMAGASGIDERAIAALVLAPAVLDAYRYFRPEAKWATWLSRGTKIGGVLLVLK